LHCGRSGIVTAACAVALGGVVKVAWLWCHRRLYHLHVGTSDQEKQQSTCAVDTMANGALFNILANRSFGSNNQRNHIAALSQAMQ